MTTRPRFDILRHCAFMSETDRHGVIVNAHIGRAQDLRRRRYALPLIGVQLTREQVLRRDKSLAGKQSAYKLLTAHFKREHSNGLAAFLCDIHCDIQRNTRFAHAGSCGDEYKLALVKAEDVSVKVVKPR